MTPPKDGGVDTQDPLSIAVWAEARARHEGELGRHTPCPVSDRHEGSECAYGGVARLIVGLPEGATLREIRHEIYAQGHEGGIVPWEDPEAAERPADDFGDPDKVPAVPRNPDEAEAGR